MLGGPRQDDLCLRVHPPTHTLIVAVADGVSAAARSHLAAALAVRQAAAAVARQLDDGALELDWSEIFDQVAWALVEEHRRERADPSASVEEAAVVLATTLVVAAITPPGIRTPAIKQTARIATIPSRKCSDCRWPPSVIRPRLFSPIASLSFSWARLSVAMDWWAAACRRSRCARRSSMPKRCTLSAGSVLLVCTDGLALPLADGNGEVGRTLVRELSNPPDIVDFARLLDFSRSTYDDRTRIAVWPERER